MMYRLAAVCLLALELRAQISGDEFRAVVRGHLVTDGGTYDAYTVSLRETQSQAFASLPKPRASIRPPQPLL